MEIVLLLIGGFVFYKCNGFVWLSQKINRASMRTHIRGYLNQASDTMKLFEGDAGVFAELSVLQAVNEKVSIFAGQVEDYPNPKVGALYCLSLSAKRLNEQNDDKLQGVMFACSIAIQNAIQVFPHNMADKILMGEAMAILEPLMAQENEKPYMKDVDAIAVKNAEVLND